MKPLLTIVIPTYDNPQQLYWCVSSLVAYTDFPYKVVVVNNGERNDKMFEDLQNSLRGFPLEVLGAGTNLGWMGAINLGLAKAETPYFCMLNDDVVFIPGQDDFWRRLVGCLDDEDVAAVGPCSNFVAGVQNLFSAGVPNYADTTLLIGFCLLGKTDILKKVGGLDQFLPGGDDLDLSIRLRKAGYRLMSCRTAYLHHIGQQTGKRLHGDDWDSDNHKEVTNNALIQKHGMLEWYSVVNPAWSHTTATKVSQQGDSEDSTFERWLTPLRGQGLKGLNLGCGNRKCTWEDLTVVGIDIAEPGERGTGGRKFEGAAPDIVGDATILDFVENESQDFIVAQHLLEHLLDPIAVLRRWKEVLRPGGFLFLAVPDQTRVPGILLDSTHLHAYTPESLGSLISLVGFTVLEVASVGWGVAVCKAQREVGK